MVFYLVKSSLKLMQNFVKKVFKIQYFFNFNRYKVVKQFKFSQRP